MEPFPDPLASVRDAHFKQQLAPMHFEPFAFTDTLVLRVDQRHELAWRWVECKGNGDVCQAKRAPFNKFRLTPPEKFDKVEKKQIDRRWGT
ncbi:MAG TPA: hypothetical protein VMV04_11205 [Thermodesulfobacteriota bacterium]|nr:hypothetical protein [Thermodesulfobacteriota bacterium]